MPSLHRFVVVLLLASTALFASACSDGAGGSDFGETSSDLVTGARKGVDYAWGRPSPSVLHADGYTFAARYLSYDTTGKNLTASEAKALVAAGVDVVSNWEWGAEDALDGYSRGVEEAKEAQSQADGDGMPAGRPIYFSVDFDATEAQQAAINSYFDGVASVIGKDRTGAYGGYWVVKRLFDAGKIKWGWQTYAWSGGQWDARAQMRQVQNGVTIDGVDCDVDQAVADDFGQWHATPPLAATFVGQGSDAPADPSGKSYFQVCAGAPVHFWFELKNTGAAAWSDTNDTNAGDWGKAVRLGVPGDTKDPFAGVSRVSITEASDSTVAPGGTTRFTKTPGIAGTAPKTPGTYKTTWRLVDENRAWFGPTMWLSFDVIDCPIPADAGGGNTHERGADGGVAPPPDSDAGDGPSADPGNVEATGCSASPSRAPSHGGAMAALLFALALVRRRRA